MAKSRKQAPQRRLAKCPSGIRGLDQITSGGLPRGRPTLVCGGAGTGKTLFGMEFLVRGATKYGEHGVFVSFEERASDLSENTASLGFELDRLMASNKILVDQIRIERNEILETGEYNLDGLFIRLAAAIDSVGAKRVVLDTIEVLFGALSNVGILRAELHRLFAWLKDKGVTTLVTGERGDGSLTRQGLEEYVSDCVILLDQRVIEQIATRRIRVVKYRGSVHGTNEYPFLIDSAGFVVLPITAIALDYPADDAFVSTGTPKLDAMLGGKGFFRGSTLMVSGSAGTGKTSMAAQFADAACRRGERCLYFAFEESPQQLSRNMRSIGIDLQKWVKRGLLRFCAARPSTFGLEVHISMMLRAVEEFHPQTVVLDPVSSFEAAGTKLDALSMLMRLIDRFKSQQISAMLVGVTSAGEVAEHGGVGVSSLIDGWILLRSLEQGGERTRALYVLKARGIRHSNQVRELLITDKGLDLEPIHVGPEGILVGSARSAQELRDRIAARLSRDDIEQRKDLLVRKRGILKSRIGELESEYAAEAQDLERVIQHEISQREAALSTQAALVAQREKVGPGSHRNGAGRAK
jgi:circadian clock protein KaiC